jgi:hypothetical protein
VQVFPSEASLMRLAGAVLAKDGRGVVGQAPHVPRHALSTSWATMRPMSAMPDGGDTAAAEAQAAKIVSLVLDATGKVA